MVMDTKGFGEENGHCYSRLVLPFAQCLNFLTAKPRKP